MNKSKHDLTYQDYDGNLHEVEVYKIEDEIIYPAHVNWSLLNWTVQKILEDGSDLRLYEDTDPQGLGIFALSREQVIQCILVFEDSDGW